MSAEHIRFLYVVLTAVEWFLAAGLILLNIRTIRRQISSIPPFLDGRIGSDRYQTSADCLIDKQRFALADALYSLHRENLSSFTPNRWYADDTHPAPEERIEALYRMETR